MYVEFTDAAKADLKDIVEYGHAHFGRSSAEAFYQAFLKQVQRLVEFPELGRVYDGVLLGQAPYEIRVITIRRYQVFYEVTQLCVRIHAVIPRGKPRDS